MFCLPTFCTTIQPHSFNFYMCPERKGLKVTRLVTEWRCSELLLLQIYREINKQLRVEQTNERWQIWYCWPCTRCSEIWVTDMRGKLNSSTQKLFSSLLWKFLLNSAEFKMFCTLAPACQDSDYVNLSYQTFKVVKLSSKLMSNVREISMFSFKFMFLYFVQNHQSTDYPALVLFL